MMLFMDSKHKFTARGRKMVLAALCISFGLFLPLRAVAVDGAGAASRGFKSEVSLAMATAAALTEARLAAMEAAVRELVRQDEIRLFLDGEVLRDAPRPDPLALAWGMLDGEESASSVSGVPPDMQVRVSLQLSLNSGSADTAALTRLLARPELLDLYARALRLQAAALHEYDAAALFFLRPGVLPSPGKKESLDAESRLGAAYAGLEAALGYLSLLPDLYPLDGGLPEGGGKDLLPLVERLAGQGPDNYLLSLELARLRLLGGGAIQAREALDRIIATQPDFAQAHALRGLCMLWLKLPALALADFDRAIGLEPYHAGFFENRALTQRILENVPAMCEDLAESCRLGECAGSEWASAQDLCGQ